MGVSKKTFNFLLIIFIFILLFYPLLFFFKTYKAEPFWITINGTVKIEPQSLERYNRGEKFNFDKPLDVRIEHLIDPYKNSYFRSRVFTTTNITWKNQFSGVYTQTLEVPRTMDLMIYAQRESPKILRASSSKKEYTLNLFWSGYTELESSTPIFSHYYDWTYRFRPQVRAELKKANFKNSTQEEIVEADIILAEEQMGEAGAIENNQSLLGLIYANWFLQRAWYKIDYFKLKNCVEESKKEISNHSPILYNNPYELTNLNISDTYLTDSDYILANYQIYNYKEIDRAHQENWHLVDRNRHMDRQVEICEANLNDVKNIYSYQEGLVKERYFYIISLFLISFLLGGLVFNLHRYSKNLKHLFNKVILSINNWKETINLKESGIFLVTIIVGISVANLSLLQSDKSNQYFLLAVVSLFFDFVSLVLCIIGFSKLRGREHGRHKFDIWILITLFLSILFYPFVITPIVTFITPFFILLKEFLIFIKEYIIGSLL